MSQCGISQLFSVDQNECPVECPFWAPSPVWKYIGVCSKAINCNIYNPILNYADKVNNVCLPCKVFGCVSCKYSNSRDSILPITDTLKKLPDYCIKCAKGYKRSSDGQLCYILTSNLWSNMLMYLCAFILFTIAIVTLRLLIKRDTLKNNIQNLLIAMKNQQRKLLRYSEGTARRLYDLSIDMTTKNISGVGLMLYFRSLVFLTLVMSLLFFASLAHVHIPCSKMIRIFKEPFRIYYFMRRNDVPRRFIPNFFNKNVDKLVDDIFHFKSVDDAINWNVVQYSNEVSGVMYVLYLSIMIMTVVYLVSQKKAIESFSSKSSKIKDLTVVIKNLPRSLTNEDEISKMIYDSTSIQPVAVSICYDLKPHKKVLYEFLESFEELKNKKDVFVNFDRIEEFNRSFVNLESSGECFVTFETTNDARLILNNFRSNKFQVCRCDVEPENVLWENVGYEENINMKIFGISLVTIGFVILYSILFFLPYAFYSISSPMTHILEMLLLGLYVELGNMLITFVLKNMIEKSGIINREVVDGYMMFCNYFIKLLNLIFNIILSHFINYGGRNKFLSMFTNSSYRNSPSFKVGEEVSFSLSFSIYMVNVLILIPNGLFILFNYILPLFNSFLVVTMDFDSNKASKLLEYPYFDLSNNYTDDLSNITCCLFLMFLIKDRKQGCLVFFSLCVSYFLNYVKSQFVVLRRSSRKFYSTWRLSYFTYIIWAFPTLIIALCPRYWNWRGGEGRFASLLSAAAFHILIYSSIIYFIFGPPGISDSNINLKDVLEEKLLDGLRSDQEKQPSYNQHNPVYRLKMLTREYNVL